MSVKLTSLLLVGAGGFIGSICRYLIGQWLSGPSLEQRLPIGTFIVNVLGCAAIGAVSGLLARQVGAPAWLGQRVTAFLMVGVLGGFTTFSAFGNETFELIRRGHAATALIYAAMTLGFGLLAVWLAFRLANR